MVRRVGKVAYELDLSPEAHIHLVFHVSQLKLKLGTIAIALPKLPPVNAKGDLQPEPVEVLGGTLDRRITILSSKSWFGGRANRSTMPPGRSSTG